MIEGIVFDFDGTLAELRLNFQYVRDEVLKVLSEYVSIEQLDKKRWTFIIEMINELSRECEPCEAKALVQNSFRRLAELECEEAMGKDVFPFTRDTLRWLRERGIKIGIITRSCTEAISLVFKDLPDYVDAIVTRHDTTRVKPHPQHIETVLARLQVAPEKALMVGDHPTDIMAGKAFCVKTVGVLTGIATKEALEEAGADFIAADIRSLPEIVAELSGVFG